MFLLRIVIPRYAAIIPHRLSSRLTKLLRHFISRKVINLKEAHRLVGEELMRCLLNGIVCLAFGISYRIPKCAIFVN